MKQQFDALLPCYSALDKVIFWERRKGPSLRLVSNIFNLGYQITELL